MMTDKQANLFQKRIEHGEFPDLGLDYYRLLSDARYNTLAETINLPDWIKVFPRRKPMVRRLQYMDLIDAKYRLTKLGWEYYRGFNISRYGKPRPEK